jgi:beta-glucanase (GH16 family)
MTSLEGAVLAADQPSPLRQASDYKLVFEDDFNSLDLSQNGAGDHTWYEGVWFNSKHSPPGNVFASASILSLNWRKNQGSLDTSISTVSRDARHYHAWRYGYFEARMRWDAVPGAWPSFWLIPIQDVTGEDVHEGIRRSGEIDIFEGMGDDPHTYFGTLHEWIQGHTTATTGNAFKLSRDLDFSRFHTYGLLWEPGKVTWYLDDQPLHVESTTQIFDQQDFFLVLGMQEGVDWKSGDLTGVSRPTLNLSVDWVRVWQKQSQGAMRSKYSLR